MVRVNIAVILLDVDVRSLTARIPVLNRVVAWLQHNHLAIFLKILGEPKMPLQLSLPFHHRNQVSLNMGSGFIKVQDSRPNAIAKSLTQPLIVQLHPSF
jgi:hypothetical protein